MFLSRGLTCYTDVESNGRDAPYPNPNRCQTCDLEETRMHAQMTVSQAPMLPKCRQHGLTYLYRWTTPRIVELRVAPKDQVHDPTHTGFNVRARFGLNKPKLLQNLRPPLFDVLSRGLTCYTDVGSNGRDAHT
jgi:hypothetical protein